MFMTKILYIVIYFATGFFIPVLSRFLMKFYPCSLHSYVGDILKYLFNVKLNKLKHNNNKHNILKKQYFYNKLLWGILHVCLFATLTFLIKNNISKDYPLHLMFIFLFLLGFSSNIDARYRIIPDIITLPMLIISLLTTIYTQEHNIISPINISINNSIYSMLYVYILCFTFALMFYFKYPYSFGGGDIKLLTAVAGFTGVENLSIILIFTFIFAMIFYTLKKEKYLALAPLVFPSFLVWLFVKILAKNYFPF